MESKCGVPATPGFSLSPYWGSHCFLVSSPPGSHSPGPPPPPGSPFPQVPPSRVTPSHPGPSHPGLPPPGHPLFTQAPPLSGPEFPASALTRDSHMHTQSSRLNIYHLHTHAHTHAQGGCPWVHTCSQACARPPHAHHAWPPGSAVSLAPWALSPQEVRQGAGQALEVPQPPPQPRPLPPTCLLPFPSRKQLCARVFVYVHLHVCPCACVFACVHVHVSVCVCVCACVPACTCVCLCLPWSPPGSAPVPSGLHPEALSLHQTGQSCPRNAER